MDCISPLDHLQVGQWAALALIAGQRREIAKNTLVIGATHYKCHTEEEHEKLLIVLKTPRDGASTSKITYVVTDRGPDPYDVDTMKRQSSSILSSPSSSAIGSPSSPEVRANDRIFIPGTGAPSLDRFQKQLSKRYDALCTMTLVKPMSLAQLAVLLQTFNQHSAHYNPLTYQCYWYAYTVWEVVRLEFGGIVTENKLQDRRGKYKRVNVRHQDSVEAIIEMYTNAWRALCEEELRMRQNEEEVIRQVNLAIMIL
jgi:hypothetical protein